jgi:glucosamine--fructose-6-phosphate aminotransferase (isomerizing)
VCGIIGYIGDKDVVPILLEGLKRLEYRGYDSAGIAILEGDRIRRRRVKGKISALETSLKQEELSGNLGLGHTRWATHGRPSEENAHPHQDCTGSFVVVHNGIIENYLELKRELRDEGHEFVTETDTEILAHLVEKFFTTTLEDAVLKTIKRLDGAFAIGAVSTKDPGKIVLVKMGPPAIVGLGEGEYFVSSDINPLLQHTQDIVFLDDGEMAVLDSMGAVFFDFDGNKIEKKVDHLNWNPLMIEKSGFKHFMLKEIFEQPQVIRDTLQGRLSLDTAQVYLDEVGIDILRWREVKRVVLIACGTSYNASLVGKYFIEALAGIPVDVEYGSEYRYRDFILNKNALVIAVSQSGETADTLAAMRAIRKLGPLTLAICNVAGSSIAREADGVLMTHAGPEIGVAATKTFSAQMTALALLALYLAQVNGKLKRDALLEVIQELQRIPHKVEEILQNARNLERLSLKFKYASHFLYLGRWANFPIALEGALKLKEISYIHAEGYPAGEMKHGPIALIDDKMPTMAIIPKDRVYDKILSNISEIKARLGYVLAVASEDDDEIRDKVDEVIPIPAVYPLFSPFLTAVPLQLFAYYIAAARGADVDQPRNLAKSVTVE